MKKLHEAITAILQEKKIPLSPSEIAEEINFSGIYERSDGGLLTTAQISARVNQYPSLFISINGRIIHSDNKYWKELLSAHLYIQTILRELINIDDRQFFVSALFFYKRLVDVRFKYGTSNALENDIYLDNYKKFTINELQKWLYSISNLDRIIEAPVPLFRDLAVDIERIPTQKSLEIIQILNEIDTSHFSTTEFGAAFEFIIEGNSNGNFRPGTIGTPRQIVELMASLLAPQDGIVFDPVCRTGTLLVEIIRRYNYERKVKGTDLNHNIIRLAFMNLAMNGVGFPDIKTIDVDYAIDEKFKYITSDLSLSGFSSHLWIKNLPESFGIVPPKSRNKFGAIILYILSKLNEKGKSVITVPENFLFSAGFDKHVREKLVNGDLVESVISLPIGSLKPYASGKASILVLNKAKPSYLLGKIKFIDAENYSTTSKKIFFDVKKIVNDYQENSFDNKNLHLVDNSYVLSEGNLQVSHYAGSLQPAIQLLDEKKGVLLGDLVEIKSGINLIDRYDADHLEGFPYIKIENLEKDILGIYLSSQKIEKHINDFNKYKKWVTSEEALFIARIGDHLKPTYFKPDADIPKVITHAGVFTLIPFHKIEFSLEYLYYQLYTSFVQKQIEVKRMGAVMPYISIKALKEIVIPYMPIDAQIAFVSTQKANIIATEREKVNQRLKAIGFEEEGLQKESDIVRTLVHELRPKLSIIHLFSKHLKRIIDKNKISELREDKNDEYENTDPYIEDLVEPRQELSIGQICEKIIHDSKDLSDILSSVKDVMSLTLKQEGFSETDMYVFLENIFESKRIEIGNKYSYIIKGGHVLVEINEDSIKLLIDQLLLNAESHAFKRVTKNNKIIFNIKQDKERGISIIEYSNNGDPFTFSAHDYITPFQKSQRSKGSGIGGNLVYRIVKAHKGDITIKENVKKGFFMTIELPLKQKDYE